MPTPPIAPMEQESSIRRFATYFGGYMGVSSLVTAALPIAAAGVGTISMYDSLRGVSATFASLLCFLILGFVVYSRHYLGSVMFMHSHARAKGWNTIGWPPVVLLLACTVSIFSYLETFQASVISAKRGTVAYASESSRALGVTPTASAPDNRRQFDSSTKLQGTDKGPPEVALNEDGKLTFSTEFVIKNWAIDVVPSSTRLVLLYLLIFMTAEAAFVLMAMREYLQEQFGISDVAAVRSFGTARQEQPMPVDSAEDLPAR